MKQQFKTTKIPLVLITLEKPEDIKKFDEMGDPEEISRWLDELHEDGVLTNSYNVNHMTWQGTLFYNRVEFNLLYDNTGEMVKLIVKKAEEK